MISTRRVGRCSVVSFDQPICLQSSIIDSISVIKKLLAQGDRYIGFEVPQRSMFDSPCLSVLLLCYEHIHRFGGVFIIINPTPEISSFLHLTSLGHEIIECSSVDSLPVFVLDDPDDAGDASKLAASSSGSQSAS